MLVNIHEAKTQLSRLVEQAAAGEDIIIGKAGRPMARLVAYSERTGPREPGALRGEVWVADDSDETPAWLVEAFEGGRRTCSSTPTSCCGGWPTPPSPRRHAL